MPPLNFYLDADTPFPPEDEKKIKSMVGKILTVALQKGDIKNGQPDPSFKWRGVILDWIKSFKLSQTGFMQLKTNGVFDGRIKEFDDYELFVTVNSKRHKATLTVELAKGVVVEIPEPPEPSYENTKVKTACSSREFQAKIRSISLAGRTETGHGPVEYLDGALHAHVTNTHSVAWKWKGDKMHIVATGKKNSQNKQQARPGASKKLKTSQYDWDEG